MTFDSNSAKIIIALLSLLTVIVSGALISIKKIRKKNSKNKISNIQIKGERNKVVGGDDYSWNK